MDWFKYYQLFASIRISIEDAFRNKESFVLYHKTPNSFNEYSKTIKDIETYSTHYFEQYKNSYIQKSKSIRNEYSLIDSELKDIIGYFLNDKFAISTDAKSGDNPIKILMYYEVELLKEDLRNGKIKAEMQESLTFYMLWGYLKYWFWLHERNEIHKDILHHRLINDASGRSKSSEFIESKDDDEMIIDLILTKWKKPNKVFRELKQFLSSLGEKQETLIFYVEDRVYELFLVGEITKISDRFRDVNREKRTPNELQEFYNKLSSYLNKSYKDYDLFLDSIETQKEYKENAILVWNGKANTLTDVFHQLTKLKTKDGKKFLGSNQKDIINFLKANFNVFQDTPFDTVRSQLSKSDNKPKKAYNKITLKVGFSQDDN